MSELNVERLARAIHASHEHPNMPGCLDMDRESAGLLAVEYASTGPMWSSVPADLRQKAVDALVSRVARLDIRAWQRDGEEVVTMSRSDIDKLLSITTRARQLTRTRQRMVRS